MTTDSSSSPLFLAGITSGHPYTFSVLVIHIDTPGQSSIIIRRHGPVCTLGTGVTDTPTCPAVTLLATGVNSSLSPPTFEPTISALITSISQPLNLTLLNSSF